MQSLYRKRDDCRLCGAGGLEAAVPLAPLPLATPDFAVPGAGSEHPIFREAVPLELSLCPDCGLLQIPYAGNPEVQYSNYIYTTSSSLGLVQHFQAYAAELLAKLAPIPGTLVVELGSNDGTLLRCFLDAGMRVVGVDPAREIGRRATEAGIRTVDTFFTTDVAKRLRAECGPAGLVLANNTLANIDALADAVAGVEAILADDGVFVIETQYGVDVVEKNLLDCVYHAHLSYFNVRPLVRHFAHRGMEVFDVQRIATKGGSIRVFVQRQGGPHPVHPVVAEMIRAEEAAGHYTCGLFAGWSARIASIRDRLTTAVADECSAGRTVGGYGVSAGTTALLGQFGLTNMVDVLFDDAPAKDPLLVGPGYAIPVRSTDAVYDIMPGVIILFAWRYARPIMEKHTRYLEMGGKFLVPLPDLTVVDASAAWTR